MISVIIPIFNAEKHIKSILNNLLQQSESNFEVILIDDGSTDQSAVICDSYADADPRFRVIRQKNAGVSTARNRGMEEAVGEYIVFLDADDEIPDDYLKELLKVMISSDADVVVCDVAVIREKKEISRFNTDNGVFDNVHALDLLLSRKMINSGPCAKMFKATIVDGRSFPNFKAYEDILFVRDVFEAAQKIATTNKTEYRYIQNDSSTMHQFIKSPSMDIVKVTEDLVFFIENKQNLSPECLYITFSHLFQYVRPIEGSKTRREKEFVRAAQKLFREHMKSILKCSAFPWKEKMVYVLFGMGFKNRM